ncbi:hypothetical protein J4438_01875 [Candidatus Woesearchaeota archaeon]|nr:hypothetical protein [Candidatus Woesearchaeota archaeon]
MGKKKRIKHNTVKNKKRKHSNKLKKKHNFTKRLLQKKKVKIPIIKFPTRNISMNKPAQEKENTKSLTGYTEILKNKEPTKKPSLNKPEKIQKIKLPKKKSVIGFKIFLLILFIIIGAVALYLFNSIYIYILFGAIILFQLINIFKKPKKKKEELAKIIGLPEQPKKIYLTEFDKFYNYIMEKKKISVSNTASYFKMNKKQVEDWARILESRNLILIHYPLIGEPELRSIE